MDPAPAGLDRKLPGGLDPDIPVRDQVNVQPVGFVEFENTLLTQIPPSLLPRRASHSEESRLTFLPPSVYPSFSNLVRWLSGRKQRFAKAP